MRHRTYCIPTGHGQIEVTKGTFLTFNKRNLQKNKEGNATVAASRVKHIKKGTFGVAKPPTTRMSKDPTVP